LPFNDSKPPSSAFLLLAQTVWAAVLGYAKSANVPPASFAAALPVLATSVRRQLAQPPPGFHRLWGLQLLQQSPSRAALDFSTAAVLSGRDIALDSGSWQPKFLSWLHTAPGGAEPGSIVEAVAAILKLSLPSGSAPGSSSSGGSGGISGSGGSSEDAPSLGRLSVDADRWWQWWQEDSVLSAQIAGLIRGEMLMRARALGLVWQQQEAAAGRRSAQRQQLGAGLAPAQLQEQAAEVLAERLEDAMRQPPSPALAGSHHAQQNSRLAQLLGATAAAVAVSTLAAEASRPAGRAVLACWSLAGGLAGKLALALEQCGNLLAEASKRLEGFVPAEEQRLRVLLEALHRYQGITGSGELADCLLR
jgi:hypothetical protein